MLLVKAALATVLAWQFAVQVLHSPVPFYAPMAALLVVDRTMVRSLSASAQRIAAVVLGLGVAWVAATFIGVNVWTMFVVILVALVIGRWSRLGDHGIQVPAMVLLALITASGTDEEFTSLTIVETIAGGLIGVAVNALVFAPLHLTKPRQRVTALADQVRDLLLELADGLRRGFDAETARGWYRRGGDIADRTRFIVDDIRTGRESTRFNPREGHPTGRRALGGLRADTVKTLRHALWQVTGIGRTLVDAADERQPAPSPDFLSRYADALASMAEAVQHFGLHDEDVDPGVRPQRRARPRGARRAARGGPGDPARRPRAVARLRLAHQRRDARRPRARVGSRRGVAADRHRARCGSLPKTGLWARLTRGARRDSDPIAEHQGGAPSRGERQRLGARRAG